MSVFHSAAARILAPLSELLHKPLSLVDPASAEAGQSSAVRMNESGVAVIAHDGHPFREDERRIIVEVFEVLRMARESEARYDELEQRMLMLQRDNLDLTVKNRRLCEVSSRDALTGLYNRSFVIEKLDSELNRALRHGSPMSILLLDVDHFKRVNDTWGHAAGDLVLQSIGQLLRDSCRVYDIPGRYGGEEFCILLPETRLGNTNVVAERIRSRLEATHMSAGNASINVTVSIGIAGLDNAGDVEEVSPAALIDRADRALYTAKNRGRNRIELWDGALLSVPVEATSH